METLKQTIMRRDNISSTQADQQIAEAREELQELLAAGLFDEAEEICATHFGLEPDYIMNLM